MRILVTESKGKIGSDFCTFFNQFYGIIGIDRTLGSTMSNLLEDDMVENFKNKLDVIVHIFDCSIRQYAEIELLKEFAEKINCKTIYFVNYIGKKQKEPIDKVLELIDTIKIKKAKIGFGLVNEDFESKMSSLFQAFEDFMGDVPNETLYPLK